ncbi:hypothetical protein P3X46_001594 [Hevea brasiliensis]|uniref:Peptidase C1A papain C-terminal domain-containing protein n=1 Tax=Hevea brasiliensis TaxID=3981 RepID=A0ABQ9NDL6_HEVBR|nr:hypothetical protein P3X46_001594 [Hevea brasiliensis]
MTPKKKARGECSKHQSSSEGQSSKVNRKLLSPRNKYDFYLFASNNMIYVAPKKKGRDECSKDQSSSEGQGSKVNRKLLFPRNKQFIKSPLRRQKKFVVCWAKATATVIEARWNQKNNLSTDKCLSLSSQVLINNFGELRIPKMKVLEEFLKTDGVCLEENCNYLGPVVTITEKVHITSPISDVEVEKLVKQGPVLAFLRISNGLLNLKKGQIFDGPKPHELKDQAEYHAIVITGIAIDSEGNEYWEFRNSWGEQWCDEGYGRVRKGSGISKFVEIWYPEDVNLINPFERVEG